MDHDVIPPSRKRMLKAKKASKLPVIERRNWLIHSHFIRKEFNTCKSLVQEQLAETNGQCEYAIFIQALIMRIEGEVQQSLELFQACHQINPTNPDNMKQIAKNLILLGKHKSAIDCYNCAINLGEKDWEICHCLGVCYHFLKEFDKAENYYKEALSKNRHAVSYSTLAKLYQDAQDNEKAISILQKGINFSSEDTDLLTSLGLLHLRNENFHKAFELLGQALTYDPEKYKAILAAGTLMQRHGDFDVALMKYRVAAQQVPESSTLWNNIAMCFFGKNKNVASISCLKRANYLSPFDWKILYNLSLLHLTMQQYASAFQFASTGIGLKPDCGALYMLLAVALTNLGQTENAERAYEKALDLDSKNPHSLINFCIFLHNNGCLKKAAKYLGYLVKLREGQQTCSSKEVEAISRRLSAALHVGEKVVAELDNEKQKKKKNVKKQEAVLPASEGEQQNSIEALASPSGDLKQKKLMPPLPKMRSPNLPPLQHAMAHSPVTSPGDIINQRQDIPERECERKKNDGC